MVAKLHFRAAAILLTFCLWVDPGIAAAFSQQCSTASQTVEMGTLTQQAFAGRSLFERLPFRADIVALKIAITNRMASALDIGLLDSRRTSVQGQADEAFVSVLAALTSSVTMAFLIIGHWPSVFMRWSAGGVFSDLVVLYGCPVIAIFVMQNLIKWQLRRAGMQPIARDISMQKLPSFKRILPAIPFLLPASIAHEFAHYLVQNLFFDSDARIVMTHLLGGYMERPGISVLNSWSIEAGLSELTGDGLMRLAGYFGTQVLALIVWRLGAWMRTRPGWRHALYFGATAISIRSLVVLLMSYGSGEDFAMAARDFAPWDLWVMPLVSLIGAAIPLLILWMISREEVRKVIPRLPGPGGTARPSGSGRRSTPRLHVPSEAWGPWFRFLESFSSLLTPVRALTVCA